MAVSGATRRRPVAAVAALSLLAASACPPARSRAVRRATRRAAATIKVGQAKDFSRIEFHWAGGQAVGRSRRDGQTLILRFSRKANPDLADLRVHPPKWLKTAEQRQTGGGLD